VTFRLCGRLLNFGDDLPERLMADDPSTRASLLERLRQDPTDQQAWSQFVRCYGPKIFGWCRRWGLQEADAHDVTQNVLTVLAVRMKTFTYDPALRFRGWLHTVTRHAWSAFTENRRQAVPVSGDTCLGGLLETVEAREDLVRRLEEQFDHELLELALARTRQRVEPHTWEAFRLTPWNSTRPARWRGGWG
jgi:RNA polymerase sigma-70 factor (ECF subfamily)